MFMKKAGLEKRPAGWIVVALLSAFFAVGLEPYAALPATLVSQEQASSVVSVRNVAVKDGAVSGEIVNNSSRTIRDVQLLIRYTWLWKNEMRPGQDELSDAVYYTVESDVPPRGTKPFTYKRPTPLPARADGHYEVSVSVAGFTEVIPPK
jgi:hypothetical protein